MLLKILLFIIATMACVFAYSYFSRLRRPSAGRANGRSDLSAKMTRSQACAVLGLPEEGLDKAAVIAAHRRLMQRVHPDKGGSTLLAQQLNEAKRVLLAAL